MYPVEDKINVIEIEAKARPSRLFDGMFLSTVYISQIIRYIHKVN